MTDEIKDWLSSAKLNLSGVVIGAEDADCEDVSAEFAANGKSVTAGAASQLTNGKAVRDRVAAVTDADGRRAAPFADRIKEQEKVWKLPLFPTTTIGSFPQTKDIRINRQKYAKGLISKEEYSLSLRLRSRELSDSKRRLV